jgi:predicted nucleic acid-binding protein
VIVVSNSSPLIAVIDIGLGALVTALFGEVFMPPAVRQEVFTNRSQPSWIIERPLTNPDASGLLRGRLGAGEREAIALTLEVSADLLLMGELAGRRTATGLGVRVMGTLGVLLRAKAQQLIPAVAPVLDQLVATGFYVDDELAARVRRTAGELGMC